MRKIINAKRYFYLHKNIVELNYKYRVVSNSLSPFIDDILDSLINSCLQQTCLLLDKHKDSKGIPKFLNICEENGNLFKKKLQTVYINLETGKEEITTEKLLMYIRKLMNSEKN